MSARLVTIGIRTSVPEEEHITQDVPLQLRTGDVLLVDGMGDRLNWMNSQNQRKLAGILPSPRQQAEIRSFIEQGGTVVTLPANPTVAVNLPFYREELPAEWRHLAYPVEVMGDLAEVSIAPFDWLPTEVWPALCSAFEIFSAERAYPQKQWITVNGFRAMTHATTQMITTSFGHGNLVVYQSSELILSSQILKDLRELGIVYSREVVA